MLIDHAVDENEQATDRNTLVFELKLACERNPHAPKGTTDPSQLYINHELKSSHLTWKPAGEQAEVFASNPPAPINSDIVLAKLRPGQEVHIELHAVKGAGRDHAKFSPVGLSVSHHQIGPQLTSFYFSDRFVSITSPHHHKKANSTTVY